MKVLVTGGRGFVGKHLSDLLNKEGHQVYSFDLRDEQDIRDYEKIRQAIDIVRPDWIFHLAALTYVGESNDDPTRTFDINVNGTINLLEAVRKSGLKTRVLIASTSEDAGTLTPYGISKSTAQLIAESYINRYELPIVVTRTYSHTGAGKGEEMAESSFAKQIAEIEAGKREKLVHGDLGATRNFSDVRDVVEGYVKAIQQPAGVYELNPHRSNTMEEILNILKENSTQEIETEYTDKYSRKAPTKNHQELDWELTIPLEDSLKDLLSYWREQK